LLGKSTENKFGFEDNIKVNLNEIRFGMRRGLNWLLTVSNSGIWYLRQAELKHCQLISATCISVAAVTTSASKPSVVLSHSAQPSRHTYVHCYIKEIRWIWTVKGNQ
jgi:hypothetical protein